MYKHIYIIFSVLFYISCSNTNENHKKAHLLENQGRYKEAIVYLNKAIDEDPLFIDAYLDRGVDKSLIEDYQGAILDYSSVIQIDTLNVLAYFNRAKNYQRVGELDSAYTDIQEAYKLIPKYKIGDVYLTIEKDNARASNSMMSIDIDDKYTVPLYDILFERGLIFLALDSLEEAYSDMSNCINDNELKDDALYWSSIINGRMNDSTVEILDE